MMKAREEGWKYLMSSQESNDSDVGFTYHASTQSLVLPHRTWYFHIEHGTSI